MAVAPSYVSQLDGARANHVVGDLKEVVAIGTVGGADTYATGGFTVSPSAFGLTSFMYVAPVTFSTGHWGIYTGGKIKVFSAAATELVNASAALQGATFYFHAAGK